MGLDVRSKFSWFFAGVITTLCIHLIYSILNNHDVRIIRVRVNLRIIRVRVNLNGSALKSLEQPS
jgi:hypothetical protein